MKKRMIGLLTLWMALFVCMTPASAAQAEKTLHFNRDGTFRILQINDFQDTHSTNRKSLQFLETVLDRYDPDLVVLVGDQLKDDYPRPTTEKLTHAIRNELSPMERRGIPFLYTFGNHDHDLDTLMNSEEQAKVYDAFLSSYATHNGTDPGTYSRVIYGSDGVTPALNIYMMDTHNWNKKGTICGVTDEQVQWYKDIGNALKASNGGTVVPSLVFQHIPVKETYKLLREVPFGTIGAVGSNFTDKFYVLNKDLMVGDRNVLHEGVSSESLDKTTGQYEAWLEQGDVIGAYFGHDHKNTFVGRTEDGIVLGYNGGFGFASYGDGMERYARIYDFNELDVAGYTRTTLRYTQEVRFFEQVRQFFAQIVEFLCNLLHI